MAIFESKYDIGDVVFFPNTEVEIVELPCQDCNGKKKWKVVTPAGTEFEIPCQRCSSSSGRKPSSLFVRTHKPVVRKLTIGKIRYRDSYEEGFEYMCNETGITSGSLYRESLLFRSEEEAMEVAKINAAQSNISMRSNPSYNKDWEFSVYRWEVAENEHLRRKVSNLNWKIEEILYMASSYLTEGELEEIKNEVEYKSNKQLMVYEDLFYEGYEGAVT